MRPASPSPDRHRDDLDAELQHQDETSYNAHYSAAAILDDADDEQDQQSDDDIDRPGGHDQDDGGARLAIQLSLTNTHTLEPHHHRHPYHHLLQLQGEHSSQDENDQRTDSSSSSNQDFILDLGPYSVQEILLGLAANDTPSPLHSPVHLLDDLLHEQNYGQDLSDSDDGGAPLEDILTTASDANANHIAAVHALAPALSLEANPNDSVPLEDDDDVETLTAAALDSLNQTSSLSLELNNTEDEPWAMDTELPLPPWGEDANFLPHQGQQQGHHDLPMFDTLFENLEPVLLSNPNPYTPGSDNLNLVDFLRTWAHQGGQRSAVRARPPHLPEVMRQVISNVNEVRYADLKGDHLDFQAINWAAMETTREAARARRRRTYANYVNRPGSDHWLPHMDDETISSRDSFFRFKKMNIRRDVHLAHFQLRSVLACPSRGYAFYPSMRGINRMNTVTTRTDVAVNIREFPAMGAAISTLDANYGVLMAGTFTGDYYLQPLNTTDKRIFSDGRIASDITGITNHIKIYLPRRSGRPAAAIASNDDTLRIMDIETESITSETMYPFALNCSALSPDGRLRVIVGDHLDVLITNADTGMVLQELSGHGDYGFACDWSDDGWTVATGCQDKGVKIWDSRKWCNSSGFSTPICTIRSEMAGVRNLRFSPGGSGKRVLVAAEEADFVNIIDAQSFMSKQTIDVFGEIGGVDFSDEAQTLNVLCCDSNRGGLLQFDRCGRGPESWLESLWTRRPRPYGWMVGEEETDCRRWTAGGAFQDPEPF